MDGWWDEKETFYPFEESPEEEAPKAAQESSNPFKPISVSDRFEQMDTARTPPVPKAFTPPRPGQPYGQGFSRMPPLTPAKPFSQIQQGDLYGYNTPDNKPATVTPTNPYAVPPNPFGAGVGASPLGASTPDTLPSFTQRTGAIKRSDLHQTTSNSPVPIWSIDDDPIPGASAQSNPPGPYPGFPPLPQTKPAPWQQPLMTTPLQEPDKDSLDWTLPAYPEANPDWKPSEEESSDVPDFLKESQPEPVAEAPDEPKSTMEKLNIPAYLRVQPLPRKRPQPEAEAGEQPLSEAEPATPEPQPEEQLHHSIYMRPKNLPPQQEQPAPAAQTEEANGFESPATDNFAPGAANEQVEPVTDDHADPAIHAETAPPTEPEEHDIPSVEKPVFEPEEETGSKLSEPSPEEEIVSLEAGLSADDNAHSPVAVTPTGRRSRRSRFAAREYASPDAHGSDHLTDPSTQVVPAESRHSENDAPSPADAFATRKRRSRRAGQETEAAAPAEEMRPFVPAVGTEDSNADASAARPAEETIADTAANGMSRPLYAYVRRNPEAAAFTPPADIDGEDDWKPFAAEPPFSPEAPLFTAPDSPFAHDLPPIPDAPEQEWSPFGEGGAQVASRFPEDFTAPVSPFAHDLPPIPDAPEQEWSPFGGEDAHSSAGSLFGDRFPETDLFNDGTPPGNNAPKQAQPIQTDALFPLFGDESTPPPPKDASSSFSLLTEAGDLFQDGSSNLSAEESPLYGTSSFDAGEMPNPTRGHLPYELVSEFDTLTRQKEAPQEDQPLFECDWTESEPDSWTASNPTLPQGTTPLLTKKEAQSRPSRPPINPLRLILLILAIAMAVFCIVAGCRMLMGYVQNTEDWTRFHEDFIKQHGVSMNQAGEMVQLPQDGTTFAPDGLPEQSAEHIVADGQHSSETAAAQPTPKPAQRTKLYQYPNNPLRNPIAAITEIQKEYPEVIGRLVIPGVVDEWIMHRNNTYYLNHNYRGTSAEGGAVFMDAACTLDTPPENLHLRASGSVPGKTFHALWQYKTGGMTFIYNSEVAHVTTLYEETQYLLYAVIETSGDPSQADYFNYASHPTFATDEELMDYLALARQHSIYTLPTDVQPGDRLLTLSTVTGADDSGKESTNLVLIFRSVR